MLTIAYTPRYLDWLLGAGHPTNPERARLAVEQIHAWAAAAGVAVRDLEPTLDLDRTLREAASSTPRTTCTPSTTATATSGSPASRSCGTQPP